MKKIIFAAITLLIPQVVSAAKLSGVVYSTFDKKPIPFAMVVVLEARVKVFTNDQGKFVLDAPPGEYTLQIAATGLSPFQNKISLKTDTIRDFSLQPARAKGITVRMTGQRDIQKVSRVSMTSDEIKAMPGAFGDAFRALTAMPGITTNGFFGPLVLRGADTRANAYYIDDIPILDPRHFGGFHSIIATDIIKETDVFPSAFPATYGNANAGVISLNTIDQVEKFGGVANVGLISSNYLIKMPIDTTAPGAKEKTSAGYFYSSGRIGYISQLFPLFNDVLNLGISQLPEYYDYQVKGKYFLNAKNHLRIFALGSYDVFKLSNTTTTRREGADPLNVQDNFRFQLSQYNHSQALYYDYVPSEKFLNTLMLFSALNQKDNSGNVTYSTGSAELRQKSNPNLFGLKNKSELNWLNDNTKLRVGLEALVYDYQATYRQYRRLRPVTPGVTLDFPNFSDTTEWEPYSFSKGGTNVTLGGYAENKFQFGGLTVTPGVRYSFLTLNKEHITDPRGLIAYEFPTQTTVSAAGGQYSNFLQTNLNLFNADPDVSSVADYRAEKAYHSVVGIEQKFGEIYSIKIEGFFNRFYNLTYAYSNAAYLSSTGERLSQIQSGDGRNYGFEVMVRRKPPDSLGLYGWINYAYTKVDERRGIPGTTYKDEYINSSNEQLHSVKLIAGYRWGKHSLDARLDMQSAFPYTPIVGDDGDPTKIGRYGPVYSSTPNTRRYDPNVTLNLRYTHNEAHEWGHVSWYVEFVNLTWLFYKPTGQEVWRYDQRFASGSNPTLQAGGTALPIIPNFGVEVKF